MVNRQGFMEINRRYWDSLVEGHFDSTFYRVNQFLAGENSLDALETSVVGPVEGKSLLHLQCHFGISSLSLARLGAKVTGSDFSHEAIETAKYLSKLSGINADFIESNVYDLSANVGRQFEIVFTSYGVLCWLPDLRAWARQIFDRLKPGGRFCIVEFHPDLQAAILAEEGFAISEESGPHLKPLLFEPDGTGSYATPHLETAYPHYEWPHQMAEVISSLEETGLRIIDFQEYTYGSQGGFFGCLDQGEDGLWRFPIHEPQIPITFSIKAEKPS